MVLKQKLSEWEKERNILFVNADTEQLNVKMTEAEFNEYVINNFGDSKGVMHKDRTDFLQANGYEISRENMVAPHLSDRITPEADTGEVLNGPHGSENT